jgi:phospholipid/cholesterol/gamma-HCH transport system permease protein
MNMREWAEFTLSENDEGADHVLALKGPLRVHSLGNLDAKLAGLSGNFTRVDMSGVTDIDTTGAWLVTHYSRERGLEITGESEQARRLFAAIGDLDENEVKPEKPRPFLTRTLGELGDLVANWGQGLIRILGFLGELIMAIGQVIRHPSKLRGTALIFHMQYVGINSLWIIGLMSFLIGIVIAQQGAVQLAQFGAEIYTINLTGRLSMRELGILMTAIMVAGRSGSAFAAQIGTMKLTEEVDAMRTIGVSPMQALVVPRVLASMLMMPLLGFYSTILAIIGGATIANFALDIPFWTFLQRTQEVVPITDVWVGLIKAPVFALIVALAGCYQGMQVTDNAEEVGARTTQAVVTAIFTVIVLDAFFAIFFTKIGWA